MAALVVMSSLTCSVRRSSGWRRCRIRSPGRGRPRRRTGPASPGRGDAPRSSRSLPARSRHWRGARRARRTGHDERVVDARAGRMRPGFRPRLPVAFGAVRVTSTVIVGDDPPPVLPPREGGAVATEPTEETMPGVVELFSGQVTVTGSPTLTSELLGKGVPREIGPSRVVEVAVRTEVPADAASPSLTGTVSTSMGPGSTTTSPRLTAPLSASSLTTNAATPPRPPRSLTRSPRSP